MFQRGRVAVADAWGIPGSGKSAFGRHAKTVLGSPGDVVLRYRFSSEEAILGDADAQAVSDYHAFRAFAAQVAEDLKRQLDPKADSRDERLLEAFMIAYDEARISTARVTAKATVFFAIIKDSDVGVANPDSAALRASVREKRPHLAAALATLLRGVTQETPSRRPV